MRYQSANTAPGPTQSSSVITIRPIHLCPRHRPDQSVDRKGRPVEQLLRTRKDHPKNPAPASCKGRPKGQAIRPCATQPPDRDKTDRIRPEKRPAIRAQAHKTAPESAERPTKKAPDKTTINRTRPKPPKVTVRPPRRTAKRTAKTEYSGPKTRCPCGRDNDCRKPRQLAMTTRTVTCEPPSPKPRPVNVLV
jgi:hypothetical protein